MIITLYISNKDILSVKQIYKSLIYISPAGITTYQFFDVHQREGNLHIHCAGGVDYRAGTRVVKFEHEAMATVFSAIKR